MFTTFEALPKHRRHKRRALIQAMALYPNKPRPGRTKRARSPTADKRYVLINMFRDPTRVSQWWLLVLTRIT
jgi:hypothetical protein